MAKKKKKYQWLFADFETCYDTDEIARLKAESDKFCQSDFRDKVEGRVYGAGWTYGETTQEIDANYHMAESAKPVLKFLTDFIDDETSKYTSLRAYYHNLNFDIQFIKEWILYDLDKYEIQQIGDENKTYQLKVVNPQTKKEFMLLDSLNILRMKLSEFAKELHLDVGKRSDVLEQDMSITRPLDHKITEDEKVYLKEDVRTLAYGVLDYFKDKEWHLTTGSYAFKVFQKELKNRGLMKYFNLTRTGHMRPYDMKRMKYYNYYSFIDTPKRSLEILKRFEKYYKGGQTFVNPVYQEQVVETVNALDVNSLYPFSFTRCKVPYVSNINNTINRKVPRFREAEPIEMDDVNDVYPLIASWEGKTEQVLRDDYFVCFNMTMTIKLKDEFTFSPVSKGFCDEVFEVYEFIDDKIRGIKHARVAFAGSEYDLANWLIYYDITDCQLIEYFVFDTIKGQDLEKFRSIVNEWSEAKIHYSSDEFSDPAKKALYKLLLNSLTGKFGEKIRDTKTIIKDHEYVEVDEDEVNTRMLPMIMSLISFARYYMSQNIAKVKEDFVYCDTDSIYVLNKTSEQLHKLYDIHPTTLGCFKIEKTYDKAIYMKPKTYVGQIEDEYFFTVAGCQVQSELYNRYKMEEFLDNDKIIGKKILKLPCIGGVYLADKPFVFKGDDGIANKPMLMLNRAESGYLKTRFAEEYKLVRLPSEEEENLKEYDFTYNNIDSTYDSIIRPLERIDKNAKK